MKSNLLELDLNSNFDAVWMQETFHHLEPREKIVEKLFNLLKSNGVLFISESNASNPFIQWSLIRKRGFNTVKEFTDDEGNKVPYGNERIITSVALKKLLESNGFKIVSTRFFRLLPKRIAKNLGSNLFTGLEEKLCLEKLSFLSVHYNLIAKKIS